MGQLTILSFHTIQVPPSPSFFCFIQMNLFTYQSMQIELLSSVFAAYLVYLENIPLFLIV